MYLVLLVFGAALAAAGMIIGASGVSIHDRAFDASLLTPAVIAAVGGLMLIGLGMALRILQRIEFALAVRPMPRAVRPGDVAVTPAVSEAASELPRVPFPAKPEIRPHAIPAPAPQAEAIEKPIGKTIDPVRPKSPSVAAFDSAGSPQDSDVVQSPKGQPRSDERATEAHDGRPAILKNGGGATKVAPRFDAAARPSPPSERAKGPSFDALWPKGPRPPRAAPSVPAPAVPAAVEREASEAPLADPLAAAAPEDQTVSLSVLKSGMVDGMAYTLFSDGSIEAQLPQGTLRFGSIVELRHHIEQTPPDAAAS